jgi:hypothetical protein
MHRYLTCDGGGTPLCANRYEPVVSLPDPSPEALRAAAAAHGWSSDGYVDRCAVHTSRLGTLTSDKPVPGVEWSQHTSIAIVRGRHPWARVPHATIRHAYGWYVLYDDPEEIAALVIDERAEPAVGTLRYAYVDVPVHELTTDFAARAQVSWDREIKSQNRGARTQV